MKKSSRTLLARRLLRPALFLAVMSLACFGPRSMWAQDEEEILLDEEDLVVEVETEAATTPDPEPSPEALKSEEKPPESKPGIEEVSLPGDAEEEAELTEMAEEAPEPEPKTEDEIIPSQEAVEEPPAEVAASVPAAKEPEAPGDVKAEELDATGEEEEEGQDLDVSEADAAADPGVETEAEPEIEELRPTIGAIERKARAKVKIPSVRGGFAEFLRCGLALGLTPIPFVTSIARVADRSAITAVNDQEVILVGVHAEGTLFAAYSVPRNACMASYMGLVLALGETEGKNCRGVVKKTVGPIGSDDMLLPLEGLKEEFRRQWENADEGPYVTGRVTCLPQGRGVIGDVTEVVQINVGALNDVRYGQVFELVVPGNTGGRTYGRVVRVDDEACFVKLLKVYQTVEIGDTLQTISTAGGSGRGTRKASGGFPAGRR